MTVLARIWLVLRYTRVIERKMKFKRASTFFVWRGCVEIHYIVCFWVRFVVSAPWREDRVAGSVYGFDPLLRYQWRSFLQCQILAAAGEQYWRRKSPLRQQTFHDSTRYAELHRNERRSPLQSRSCRHKTAVQDKLSQQSVRLQLLLCACGCSSHLFRRQKCTELFNSQTEGATVIDTLYACTVAESRGEVISAWETQTLPTDRLTRSQRYLTTLLFGSCVFLVVVFLQRFGLTQISGLR